MAARALILIGLAGAGAGAGAGHRSAVTYYRYQTPFRNPDAAAPTPEAVVVPAEVEARVVRNVDSTPAEYGAPPAAPSPHDDEFCVDVSTYEPVTWVEEEAEECTTVFVKECEEKTENVCVDVTETKCEVVPYTECALGMEPQTYSHSVLAARLFVEKVCTQGKKVIPHVKLLPECKNVTKQNCVTLWETDDAGQQVWAGNEACEPVTWQECKLVPKNVKFIVPEINCTDGNELWYHEPEAVEDIRMTNTFTCQVRHSTACETQSRPDCQAVAWEECREVPVTNCQQKSVHKPVQELLHRKKCLLPDDPQTTGVTDDGYGQPRAEPITEVPLPTYSGRRSPPSGLDVASTVHLRSPRGRHTA